MRVGVVGAGTWGIALARVLSNVGHDVMVWSALPEETEQLAKWRRHPNLPGMAVPPQIRFTDEIREACQGKDILLFAVPSLYVRSTAGDASPYVPDEQIIVDVAKGIEEGSLLCMTEVIQDEMAKRNVYRHLHLVALSGPTHAEEVARDLPSAAISASIDDEAARRVQALFDHTCLRLYTHADVKGVELCGAVKNIIALASGISTGLGYGDNTRAALVTRGMAEIRRLGLRLGCRAETFSGLAGIGDLIVTAMSEHSRNNRCGCLIGQGYPVDEAVKRVGMVVEGVNALAAAKVLAEKYEVDMPITEAVYNIVYKGADPHEAVLSLMAREKKAENE